MMRRFFILLVISTITISSCVKNPSPAMPDPDLDLSFAFCTRFDVKLNVTAYDEAGLPSDGVLFSVYTENPYGEEGSRDSKICPIYQGFTENNGSINITIPAPATANSLYIIPEYAGYGQMQEVEMSDMMSVTLSGISIPSAQGTKADSDYSRDRKNCGKNFKFYSYFIEGEDMDTDFGILNTESELVDVDPLTNDFKAFVNDCFPDSGFKYDTHTCSDIVIEEDGTEIWVTYIGDGGFSNANLTDLNSLMYYTYNEGELPSSMTSQDLRNNYIKGNHNITYALLNMHPNYTVCGTRVQLLYWNGEKYVKEFPKGKRLGLAFLYQGYGRTNTTRAYSLAPENIRFSTPGLNPSGLALAVSLWSDEYHCYITGLEFGGKNGNASNDSDYNDMLVKITTSKNVSLLNQQSAPTTEETISYSYEGTLAFEDLWPNKGDYDFNDFVTDYKYTLYKAERSNQISSISLTFTPKAAGAANSNGFGIQLPILSTNISPIYSGTLDGINVLATIRVFNNVLEGFSGNPSGFINTNPAQAHIAPNPATITLKLISPVNEDQCSFYGFNPFIFDASNHQKEIHLVDYPPTLSADMSLFGTGSDKSVPEYNIYYRMDDNFPWALDIAKSDTYNWRYPLENTIITDAYLHYADWVIDHKTSWFDWTVSGNANQSLLYPYFE